MLIGLCYYRCGENANFRWDKITE